MDRSTAERWVVISALVVAAVYGYRRITETAQAGGIKNIIGLGNPVPLAEWVTAWGFVYLMLAVVTEAAPGLGGSFAILIAAGDLLANTPALIPDVTKQEQKPASSSSTGSGSSTSKPKTTTQAHG